MAQIAQLISKTFGPIVNKIRLPHRYNLDYPRSHIIPSKMIKSGDVLLSRKNFEATNLFIAGGYKHAAIIIAIDDVQLVFEAVHPIVCIQPFEWWYRHHDAVAILRPTFDFDENAMRQKILSTVGCQYDYFFVPDNEAYYCAELVAAVLAFAKQPDRRHYTFDELGLKPTPQFGLETLLPDAFLSSKKFALLTLR